MTSVDEEEGLPPMLRVKSSPAQDLTLQNAGGALGKKVAVCCQIATERKQYVHQQVKG